MTQEVSLGRRITDRLGLTGERRPWPWWMRCWVAAACVGMAVVGFVNRGPVVGAVGLVVFGGMALFTAFGRPDLRAWAQRHPVLDGMLLGPILFLAVAYLSSWPLWVCALFGVAGVGLGAAVGKRRKESRTP